MAQIEEVPMTPTTEEEETSHTVDFISNILAPGSSLHPTFLLICDAAFTFLFAVLCGMAFLTSGNGISFTKGNGHSLALIVIELCLWASVKWFVYELKNAPIAEEEKEKDE